MDNITIDQFEGPLDLLLHLLKENKMDILEIKVEIITDQYLNYIGQMEQLNLDVASSYLVMASELIELKSKMLLPKRITEEEIEEENTEGDLISRLLEYQQYKEITKTLKAKEELRKEIYTKAPASLTAYMDEKTVIQTDVTLDDLTAAFQKFLERKKESAPLHTRVTTKELSTAKRRSEIKKLLSKRKRIEFTELFEEVTREYVVVTFLAILEMAKQEELKLIQDHNFDQIICEVKE